MAREIVDVLFRKNHMVFSRIRNPKPERYRNFRFVRIEYITQEPPKKKDPRPEWRIRRDNERKGISGGPKNPLEVLHKVRKASPLGFYYDYTWKTLRFPDKILTENLKRVVVKVTICFEKIAWELEYLYEISGTTIGQELRPWELSSDPGISDHFITDLRDLLVEFFSETYEDEAKKISGSLVFKDDIHVAHNELFKKIKTKGELKNHIFLDLFGSFSGVIHGYQTDEEKILAHGMDPKTSFRK